MTNGVSTNAALTRDALTQGNSSKVASIEQNAIAQWKQLVKRNHWHSQAG